MRHHSRLTSQALLPISLVLLITSDVLAYIGPGAGIAFGSSFLLVIAAFFLAFFKILTFPIRWTIRSLRRRKALSKSRVRQVVVVGLDGQDPELTDQFLAEGLLPNFEKLRSQGGYVRLDTTLPAESPVAWSSFQTGCNPGKHKIFDFLVPNPKSCLPELCSAKVTRPSRALRLGKYLFPLSQPAIDLGRKSIPFWKTLGDHGIFSAVLRVPITFPAEKFDGVLLSAMCVPDLNGTQGTFCYFSNGGDDNGQYTGGVRVPVELENGRLHSHIPGPENTLVPGASNLRIPFEVHLGKDGGPATIVIDKKSHPLPLGDYTPWIELAFRPGLGMKVRGMARFYLRQVEPEFKLYMSPINLDPERPALPISHPAKYAPYLSRMQGRYATLGMAEDTWALNERVLDEDAFLKQAYLIHAEREKMFFDALEKTRRGLVACVFDITDRLQHMFWRYLEANHPANKGKDTCKHRDAIRDLYRNMDEMLGRIMRSLQKDALLIVMSDHGFKPFKRAVNLNSWLQQHGYLSLKGPPSGAEWYQDVDFSKTRAFAAGLGGIYINLKGRQATGIVEPKQERAQLKQEIASKLRSLMDKDKNTPAITEVYDTETVYSGPYLREAPDLVVGFNVGYRASWDCATGVISENIITDNTKSWSGDHCMNPAHVPGIFFCNRRLDADRVSIMDIGPTILDQFGVGVPDYCDGKALAIGDPS